MRRGRRRSFSGWIATLETRETRCLPPPRPPRPPLQETQSERWSSRSQTCCSGPGVSIQACCGCRPRCIAPGKQRAPPDPPPSPPPPPPHPGRVSGSRWVEWESWSGRIEGQCGTQCWSTGGSRGAEPQHPRPQAGSAQR